MSRRKRVRWEQAQLGCLGALAVAGGLAWMLWVSHLWVLLLLSPALYFWYKHNKQQQRLQYLRSKYQNEALVQRILQRNYWQGQTGEQLLDALGEPVCRDEKQMQSGLREVWKYGQWGVNRYKLRITLDNGIVIGWERKA